MAGRGRGRGRGAMIFNETKPGQAPEQPAGSGSELDSLCSMVKSLSMQVDNTELKPVTDTAMKLATNEANMKGIVQSLYLRCQEEWEFAPAAADVCYNLGNVEADGVAFRSILLGIVHADFQAKESLRKEEHKKFLGCAGFLCQVYSKLRTKTDEPFIPLTQPVTEMLELLFDRAATEEEMKCGCLQVLSCGSLLSSYGDTNRVFKLKNTIKDIIVDRKGSRELRLELIELIENWASGWTMKPSK